MLGHSPRPLKSYPGEDALALPPLQLGPEDREELLLREAHEADPGGGLDRLHRVVLPEAHPDLAVHGDHDVLVRHERDLDPVHAGEDDRPVRQGVGADRRQHDRVHGREQDRPAGHASSAGNISSSVVAVRKPSPPRFTPRRGTPKSPTARAMERRVPSPPSTTSRSTCAGSSGLLTDGTLAAGTSPAVSFSRTADSRRAWSHSRSSWIGARASPAPGLATPPTRFTQAPRPSGRAWTRGRSR